MISRFSQYLVEEEKVVYFTFGRMNPPTIGHGKLLDKLSSISGRDPYKIFVSQTQDAKKNPLSYSDKIKSVRKMFPKHARSVMINKKVRTAMEAATFLYNQGFRKIVMVVGSDRIREFDVLLKLLALVSATLMQKVYRGCLRPNREKMLLRTTLFHSRRAFLHP